MTARDNLEQMRKKLDTLKATRNKLNGQIEEKTKRKEELERALKELGIDPEGVDEYVERVTASITELSAKLIADLDAELAKYQ